MIGIRGVTARSFPVPVTILVTDVEAFGRLRNPQQIAVRRRMYEILSDAFVRAGVPWSSCIHEDRGDGVLIVIPGDVPKALVVARVLPEIAAALAAADRDVSVPPIRLRLAAHAGDAHRDRHGFVGADVNQAFRLVDSGELKRALRSTAAHCAILVSDALYQATVRHGYDGIDIGSYHPVPVHTKEDDITGWLAIPGDDACAGRVSADLAVVPGKAAARSGVQITAGGNVSIKGGSIAGRDNYGSGSR
jgi:class 3 adenylate cyclase